VADALDQYDPIFQAAGQEWNVDWRALKAIAGQESGGKTGAVSKAGAQGLMQIMPSTARGLGMTDPMDPAQSIYGAAKYMSQALDHEGDNPRAALLYYHGGPGWRQNYGPESAGYVPGVAAKYQQYAKQDTKTATDAAPPAAADDPFSKALQGPTQETPQAAQPAAAEQSKSETPDAFTQALGAPIKAPSEQEQDPLSGSYLGGKLPPAPSRVVGLETPPGYERANMLPIARNTATGEIFPAIPGIIRDPIVGLTTQGPQIQNNALVVPGVTTNPQGAPSLTPEAGSVAAFAASPLRFGGNALELQAPGLLERRAPLQIEQGNLLSPDAAARAAERPAGPGVAVQVPGAPSPTPAVVTPPGGTQSAGAAASREGTPAGLIGISPQEEAAYRTTANGNKLIEPQPVGVRDTNRYIDGETPNLAEIEQQVNTARDLKDLNLKSPEVSQEARRVAEENNQRRTTYLDNTIKTPGDILAEKAAQQADIETAKPKVFSNAGQPDVQPIVSKIQDILSQPANRQNTPLQTELRPLIDRLQNKDGTPKILDAEELWGWRQDVDRLTDKRMAVANPNLHYVGHQLNEIAGVADGQIEKVAPGYGDMLQTYKDHAQKINEMTVLQGVRNGLFNTAGGRMTMSLEKVQRLLKNVVDMQSSFGPNDYKAITQDTVDRLFNLRDSLRRSASAIELAKTPGSDTAQNLWQMIKGLASGPEAETALHAFAASHLGLAGYVATKTGAAILRPIISGRVAAQATDRGMNMLHPNIPLRDVNNPLTPP
jgi:hypothetical protein